MITLRSKAKGDWLRTKVARIVPFDDLNGYLYLKLNKIKIMTLAKVS